MIDDSKRLVHPSSRRCGLVRFVGRIALTCTLFVASGFAHTQDLKLIELFTSHGCSSCPPADRLLGELLSEHQDLMALEYHVDYWNSLVHGSDGNFVDPFSKAEYSMRQREYNVAKLAGRPGVYTPQAVINGRVAAVGSNRRHILKALNRSTPQALSIQIKSGQKSGTLAVTILKRESFSDRLEGIDIRVATYIEKTTTKITGGENRHLVLDNHHVVTNVAQLGAVSDAGVQNFEIPSPKTGEGCVVLIQEDALTPIYAAAECP